MCFANSGWIKTPILRYHSQDRKMDKRYFLDKLLKNRPSVFERYSYDLLPATFKAHDKISIECYEHGVFEQKACAHLFSAGCPECGKARIGELSNKLRLVYRYWLRINGELRVFKNILAICREFKIKTTRDPKEVIDIVREMVGDLTVLF